MSKSHGGRQREKDERDQGRKEGRLIFVFFERSLNKGAPKHPGGDVLGSLQYPQGLYYSGLFLRRIHEKHVGETLLSPRPD